MNLPITIQNWWYLLISLIGLVVIVSAIRSHRQANASQNWSGVQGKVIESRLEKRETTDGEGNESISYAAVVRYTYTVRAQEYTGDRIAFGVKPSNRKAADELVSRYPAATSVTVYYDPENPRQAVLERVSTSGWVQILIGIALVIVGIVLTFK